MVNGVFIVGNKRSGSTHLMKLLNIHPEIFVSNESDIMWVLYNYHNNKPLDFYPLDSPAGMKFSLEAAEQILSKDKTVQENFYNFQTYLMEKGFISVAPMNKKNLKYIGDQKPYQNIDPEVLPFILEHFPNAKFIHLVRHPFEVISSSMKFMKDGSFLWKGKKPDEIFDKWVFHEQAVINAKAKYDLAIHQVDYHDIISDTENQMKNIFEFLGLAYTKEILFECRFETAPNFKEIPTYPTTEDQLKMMNNFGYKSKFNYFEKTIIPPITQFYNKATFKLRRILFH
jgi:hypothetical protein